MHPMILFFEPGSFSFHCHSMVVGVVGVALVVVGVADAGIVDGLVGVVVAAAAVVV